MQFKSPASRSVTAGDVCNQKSVNGVTRPRTQGENLQVRNYGIFIHFLFLEKCSKYFKYGNLGLIMHLLFIYGHAWKLNVGRISQKGRFWTQLPNRSIHHFIINSPKGN